VALSLTTDSRSAFEALNEGLRAVDLYNQNHRIEDIERAGQFVDTALEIDNDFGLAIYYKGIILDLSGRPADAPPYFERILREVPDPKLAIETEFNLGVAYYHRYGHPYLMRAEAYFKDVIAKVQDHSLRNMARAHLAQTHAMWMRPSSTQLPDKRAEVSRQVAEHIEQHFAACQKIVGSLAKSGDDRPHFVATYQNASGMSHMYFTDHVAREASIRGEHLTAARVALLAAREQLPDDWANTCDLGSVELRIGVRSRDIGDDFSVVERHLIEAEKHLNRVADNLRPGYGFALYELGILYRVWERWEDATTLLMRAKAVPEEYRDISDVEVGEQLSRAQEMDSSYP
jgi:hypothetical protein